MYICSQIFGILSLIVTLISYHLKTKKQIFKGMCVANVLDITHYLLLNAYSGLTTKVMALIRNIFILIKEKNQKLNSNLFLLLFIIGYIILGIITFENKFSLLPMIAAIVYMIGVWNGGELAIKRIAFLCYFLWLIYNVSVMSIAGVLSNVISLISTYIAYYTCKKQKNK